MNSEVYREQYFNHLCVFIDNYFTLENLESYIDDTKALIAEPLEDDPNKYFSISQFNTNVNTNITVVDGWGFETVIPGLKSFISSRYATVSSQLDSYSHSCTALSIDEVTEEVNSTSLVYPNPSNTGVFNIVFANAVQQVSVYNIYGQAMLTEAVSELGQTELDLSAYADGIYIVELVGETRELVRVVKQ